MAQMTQKQAKELWDSKYHNLTPIDKYRSGDAFCHLFLHSKSENDHEVVETTITFALSLKGKVLSGWESTSQRQKFLAIGGESNGQFKTDEKDDYFLFNAAFSRHDRNSGVQRCVLIHKSLLNKEY